MMRIASLFLALTFGSTEVFGQAVEYNFNNAADRTENIGNGTPRNSQDFTNLDGIPFPTTNNDITFPVGSGNDGTTAVNFAGSGCLHIPDSEDVNMPDSGVISSRTISLDFRWDGTTKAENEPQMLFEEGGSENGINMFITPTTVPNTAELIMAVWEGPSLTKPDDPTPEERQLVSATINADTWYNAALVLHRFARPNQSNGTLSGYLDGSQFAQENVDFFGIERHSSDNCIGGMKEQTRIFPTNGTASYGVRSKEGFFFRGLIDNFKLYNSVVIPTAKSPTSAPTTVSQVQSIASPAETFMPTLFLTEAPTISPSADPTWIPTSSPTSTPTVSPSSSPTSIPTVSPTTATPAISPSADPTSIPTLSPTTAIPSSTPSVMPSLAPYWELITYDDFEDARWGNFAQISNVVATDSGDATRMSNPNSKQQTWVKNGTAAIRLRDDSGDESSFWHKNDHDVTEYSNLQVHFWYAARTFQNDDSFILQYSSDGGSSYVDMKRFEYGTDFQNHDANNNYMMEANVDFNSEGEQSSYAFTNQARIRFECRADGDKHRVYIDEVTFSGRVGSYS